MLDHIESIYENKNEMMKRLKKASYKKNVEYFAEHYGHYIAEMTDYIDHAEDKAAAAAEIAETLTDAVKNNYPELRFDPIHMNMFKMADWRVYYYIRNSILSYQWNEKQKYIMIFNEVPKIFIKTFVFRTGQWKIVLKGLKDGLLGRSGKRMSP